MHGLEREKDLGIKQIRCFGDSYLVAEQVSGTWDARDPHMDTYKV
jgi:ribonuclease HI